jgi:hypothetical protein
MISCCLPSIFDTAILDIRRVRDRGAAQTFYVIGAAYSYLPGKSYSDNKRARRKYRLIP